MLVDVEESEEDIPCLIPGGEEEEEKEEEDIPTLVSISSTDNGLEDTTPNIPVTIITG